MTEIARLQYQGLISQIREALRGGKYAKEELIMEMKLIDTNVAIVAPIIPNRIIDKYNEAYAQD